jgi:hypothetical protein
VLNATGVLAHTNLGRAPLSAAARVALLRAAGTTDVEFDLETGTRGLRGAAARRALSAAVPAAGDVHVVNNNAAALLLIALALAPGREIVISRGELVQIGDGFRLPEVGTTNVTTVADYADAVGEATGLCSRCTPRTTQSPASWPRPTCARWPPRSADGFRWWSTSVAACSRHTPGCRTSRTRTVLCARVPAC